METTPQPISVGKISARRSLRHRIYIANLLLALHYFLIAYVNSTFLANYFNNKEIGLLYTWGALLNAIILLFSAKILKKTSLRNFVSVFVFLEMLAVLSFAIAIPQMIIALLFIVHQAVIFMILFGFDIYLEEATENESETGETRGLYLTMSNMMLVLAPTIVALILVDDAYSRIYLISALILIPLIILVRTLPSFKKVHKAAESRILESAKEIWSDKDLVIGVANHFVLQLFYAWMIIYTPLYLHEVMQFSWKEIGFMFSIMLLPFVLFELPLGWLADKKIGEKEIMFCGFIIMIIFTGSISFITVTSFALWATVLFMTRVGASAVEITTESYFFKKVKSKDANLISVFRMARPFSFILAPALAGLASLFVDYRFFFLFLAVSLISGAFLSLKMKDTL